MDNASHAEQLADDVLAYFELYNRGADFDLDKVVREVIAEKFKLFQLRD